MRLPASVLHPTDEIAYSVPDPASLTELGLIGLFVAAFVAGSILPFSSEVVMVALLALGVSPSGAVTVATIGNVLGALTLYGMGRLVVVRRKEGGQGLTDWLLVRFTAEDPARLERAKKRLSRWGPVALLAAWVPIVGDALMLAAGLLALPIGRVTLYVTIGKGARYLALAATVVAAE